MTKQYNFYLAAWTEIADIDDFLAAQVDQAVRLIRALFEHKQEQSADAADVLDFQLGVVIKKKLISDAAGIVTQHVWLNLGLLGASPIMDKEKYRKAAKLLHAARYEALLMQPQLTHIKVNGPRLGASTFR